MNGERGKGNYSKLDCLSIVSFRLATIAYEIPRNEMKSLVCVLMSIELERGRGSEVFGWVWTFGWLDGFLNAWGFVLEERIDRRRVLGVM